MEPSNTCICHGERIDLSPRQAAEWPSHWQRRNATSGPHPLPLYAADLWPCFPASGDQVHGRRRPHGHDVRVDDRVRLARRHRERVALQGRGGAAGGEMCHKSPAPAGQPCPAAGQDHETSPPIIRQIAAPAAGGPGRLWPPSARGSVRRSCASRARRARRRRGVASLPRRP